MTIETPIVEPSRLLCRKETAARFGVSVGTLDSFVDKNIAPKPIKITPSIVRWHSHQVSEAIDRLAGITANAGHGFWDN